MQKVKIFFVYVIAATYLLLSTGIALTAHYCHDNLTSISYILADASCACDDAAEEMDCCSTEESYFQFDEEVYYASNKSLVPELSPVELAFITSQEPIFESDVDNTLQKEVLPSSVPIYILQSSFIHYG